MIGNAQLPLEDIVDLVRDFEERGGQFNKSVDKAVLRRVLFVYGTSYSQRENCIIGKVSVEINYNAAKQFLGPKEAREYKKELVEAPKNKQDKAPICFVHRETFINRKIPLNAVLSLHVDRVTNLKESIENIEHFAKINQQSFGEMYLNSNAEQRLDKRRLLTQILKSGLNLVVISSLFDEDETLKEKFTKSEQKTRILYNTLNPVFGEDSQLPIQLEQRVFDYLKQKRAVFEVRHYMTSQSKPTLSECTEFLHEDEITMAKCDYITLGHVKVPLLQLITKNNGIEGDFQILDEFKQKMGTLRLRISINHHNSARPLFNASNKIPTQESDRTVADTFAKDASRPSTIIDKSIGIRTSQPNFKSLSRAQLTETLAKTGKKSKYLLCLNFVEVILRNRSEVFDQLKFSEKQNSSLLYLKFKFLGQSYQTKFISLQQGYKDEVNLQSAIMKTFNMLCFQIGKTTLLPVELTDLQEIE